MGNISPNFDDFELLSKGMLELIKKANLVPRWFIPERAIDFLEDLREFFGSVVSINHTKNGIVYNRRGICTIEENIAEDRDETTQHLRVAFDISLYSEKNELVYEWIKKNAEFYGIGGLGLYSTFVHTDFRNSKEPVLWFGK